MKREIWRETPFSVKLLLSTSFMMNLGFYALIPYLTLYLTGSIGWTLAMAGLVLSVRQFSQQGFAFLGGVMADAFGYKGAMVLGGFDVGRETTQGMPSTSSLVKPLETLQTPTTSVSLSPLKR